MGVRELPQEEFESFMQGYAEANAALVGRKDKLVEVSGVGWLAWHPFHFCLT